MLNTLVMSHYNITLHSMYFYFAMEHCLITDKICKFLHRRYSTVLSNKYSKLLTGSTLS